MKFENDWKYIGSELGIAVDTLQAIEANIDVVRDRMCAMFASWLKRGSKNQQTPTWNRLLTTLSRFDEVQTEFISTSFICRHKQH